MRYHYEKPTIYLSMYGKRYICNHPVYDSCTLFEIEDIESCTCGMQKPE